MAQAASACNLFATRACQITQAVQHWAMRKAAAEAVSNQQAVSKSSSSGPHYINRLSSTVLSRLSRNMAVPAMCVPGVRPFGQ